MLKWLLTLPLLTVWFWISHLFLVILHFPICKMELIILSSQERCTSGAWQLPLLLKLGKGVNYKPSCHLWYQQKWSSASSRLALSPLTEPCFSTSVFKKQWRTWTGTVLFFMMWIIYQKVTVTIMDVDWCQGTSQLNWISTCICEYLFFFFFFN